MALTVTCSTPLLVAPARVGDPSDRALRIPEVETGVLRPARPAPQHTTPDRPLGEGTCDGPSGTNG